MKKILIILILTLSFIFSLTACNAESQGNKNSNDSGIIYDNTQTDENDNNNQGGDNMDWKLQTATYTVNGVDFKMILVEAGTFTMGSDRTGVAFSESPAHRVTLTKDYLMGETEVTVALWNAVMGGSGGSNTMPKTSITRNQAVQFVERLSQIAHEQGIIPDDVNFHIPTEAQWEYAAAGGESYPYAGSDNIRDVAYYASNANERLHPVGEKRENGFDLYDMSGNAAEWCTDWMSRYENTRVTDPQGPAENPGHHKKIVRGGSYLANERDMDIRHRSVQTYDTSEPHIGFRVVLNPIQ